MDYIESIQVMFEGEQYLEFLHIRNWPKAFGEYIDKRKEELLSKKDTLYQEMNSEIGDIFQQIKVFEKLIEQVLENGLVLADLEKEDQLFAENQARESEERAVQAKHMPSKEFNNTPSVSGRHNEVIISELPKGQDRKTMMYTNTDFAATQAENSKSSKSTDKKSRVSLIGTPRSKYTGIPDITFFWLADSLGMKELRFDVKEIERVFYKIEFLKNEFDEVSNAIELINQREQLLGVTPTQFSDLYKVQENLKPMHELWTVAQDFAKIVPGWIEGSFEKLDPTFIDLKIEEWQTELRRLKKTGLVMHYGKQMELLQFILDCINHLKKYFPMLRTLRTKGLAGRHWKQIGGTLKIQLDPATATLHKLILHQLHDEEKLKLVKQVCEVATKEFTVQLALEQLEKDMKAVEFELDYLQEDIIMVIQLPELISTFDEFYLRIGVLKSNPNIKNFLEKLVELERIIRVVLELVNEWSQFQNNYIYLYSIFALEEMRMALPQETKLFNQIHALYEITSASFQQYPHVFRISIRENFLTTLVKYNADCEVVKKGLAKFLDSKRENFPRLFFLSNEELYDIFGKGLTLVQQMAQGQTKSFISILF